MKFIFQLLLLVFPFSCWVPVVAQTDENVAWIPEGTGGAEEEELWIEEELFIPEEPEETQTVKSSEKAQRSDIELDEMVIEAEYPKHLRTGGSVQEIKEEQLETFEHDDPHAILAQVPGVYFRQEDGYGLRPNIGLRGASSERSKKVTLMEDGILFAPAPYAAPAAYYFPIMTRMVSVDVYKGPSAIVYGPNTIGGAINLVTRRIPQKVKAMVDTGFGTSFSDRNTHGKFHGYLGASNDWGGFLFEGVHLANSGFKELDGGGNTGFRRSEFMLKGHLNTDLNKTIFQKLDLKLGYSKEDSNETYLGLSDEDFRSNPYRRYRGSERDNMDWTRFQVALKHLVNIADHVEIETTLYHHGFSRDWHKINSYGGGNSLSTLLRNPNAGFNEVFYNVLTGSEVSEGPQEYFQLTNNGRKFISQGIQTIAVGNFQTGIVDHRVELGLRLHRDSIRRDHTEQDYAMTENGLQPVEQDTPISILKNEGKASAVSLHAAYELSFAGLTLTPGFRGEFIRTEFNSAIPEKDPQSREQKEIMLGIGAHYLLHPWVGILAGVHQGLSPLAPGQSLSVKPERSMNYEFGARMIQKNWGLHAELIGFFHDYTRILAECTFSAGCSEQEIGTQFNSGQVFTYGLESVLAYEFDLKKAHLKLPVRATYTFTGSSFQTDFDSSFPQWGKVRKGDSLPYIPPHQLSFLAGVSHKVWGFNTSITFVDKMREQAGRGSDLEGVFTDRQFFLDVVAHYNYDEVAKFYIKFDNLTFSKPIVSRRPYGARPSKPFQMQVGAKISYN